MSNVTDPKPWAYKNNYDIRYASLEDAPLPAKHYDYRPRPLWCANDEPHGPHDRRNEFGSTDYCTGRPGAR